MFQGEAGRRCPPRDCPARLEPGSRPADAERGRPVMTRASIAKSALAGAFPAVRGERGRVHPGRTSARPGSSRVAAPGRRSGAGDGHARPC